MVNAFMAAFTLHLRPDGTKVPFVAADRPAASPFEITSMLRWLKRKRFEQLLRN
jgi:hypothetical protein